MSKITLNFNSDVVQLLKDNKINVNDGKLVLIALYFNLKPTFVPDDLKHKIFNLGLFTYDKSKKEIKWKFDLFNTGEIDWLDEYRNLFIVVNKSRGGGKQTVLNKLKKFMINYPTVTKEQIINATKLYLREQNPTYVMDSGYFIEKNGNSKILEYLNRLDKEEEVSTFEENFI